MYQPAPELPEQQETERGFFKSLSHLENHYSINLTDFTALPYPYNIQMAEREVNKKLQARNRYRHLQIMVTDDNETCLSITETINNSFQLNYIPVMPIYELWQSPEHQHCGEILTAVCAYLYTEAGIDFYRDDDTYMFRIYEIMKEWIDERSDEEQDEEDRQSGEREKSDWDNAQQQGDFIQGKMMAKGFLHALDSLIANFKAMTDYEKECLRMAQMTWELWQAFPERNLYQNASLKDYEPEDYDDDYVGMHEYFSFVGSLRDGISDDLKNMVNDEFNERPRYQEPEILTIFDELKMQYVDVLAYEDRLIALIDDLVTLLFEQP